MNRSAALVMGTAGLGLVVLVILSVLPTGETSTNRRPERGGSGGSGSGSGGGAGTQADLRIATPAAPKGGDPVMLDEAGRRNPAASVSGISTEPGEIQVPGKDGRLAQRYRWQGSEPLPNGVHHVTRPEVWMYMVADRRLLLMTADEARLVMADDRPQSGELSGSVRVAMYRNEEEGGDAYTIDPATAEAELVIESEAFSFDATLYEVKTKARVVGRTRRVTFAGRGLEVIYNEGRGRIEYLAIEERESILYRAAEKKAKVDAVGTKVGGANRNARKVVMVSDRQDGGAVEEQDYYKMELTGEVVIERGFGADAMTATASGLTAMFPMSESRLKSGTGLARGYEEWRPHESLRSSWALKHRNVQIASGAWRGPAARLLAGAVFGSVILDSPDVIGGDGTLHADDVRIGGRGGLVMEPMDEPPSELAANSDARLELVGEPVTVTTGDGEATCARLVHTESSGEMRLLPGPDRMVNVTLAEGAGSAESSAPLVIRPRLGTSAFEGPGSFRRLATDGGGVRVEKGTAPPGALEGLPEGFMGRWTGGMTVEFADGGATTEGMGRLKSAEFTGDVRIDDPSGLTLEADTLKLEFAAIPGNETPMLNTITATGHVTATGVDGRMAGNEMFVQMTAEAERDPQPDWMEVTGNVKASDAAQTLECGNLRVFFTTTESPTAGAVAGGGTGGEDSGASGAGSDSNKKTAAGVLGSELRVRRVLGDGSVHLILVDRRADGAGVDSDRLIHAWGDRLDADPIGEIAVLSGQYVLVAQDTLQISGTMVEVSKHDQTITVPGAGVMSYRPPKGASEGDGRGGSEPGSPGRRLSPEELQREMERRLDESRPTGSGGGAGAGAGAPPAASAPREGVRGEAAGAIKVSDESRARVTWTESMKFTNTTGLAEFRGGVHVEYSPNRLEYDTIDANRLEVEFSGPMPTSGSTGDSEGLSGRGETRRLRRMSAIGGGEPAEPARVKAARYLDEERTKAEFVLFISAVAIDYFDVLERLEAHGDGSMLVVDNRTVEEEKATGAADQPGKAQPKIAVTGRGETLFRWTGEMVMDGGQGSLRLRDDVVLLHRPPEQSVLRLTCRELDATLDSNEGGVDALNLSGREDMKLRTATAAGEVVVRSPEREVQADRFHYDGTTMLVTLEALGDGLISIVTTGDPNAVRAGKAVWDLLTDTIRVERLAPVAVPVPVEP